MMIDNNIYGFNDWVSLNEQSKFKSLGKIFTKEATEKMVKTFDETGLKQLDDLFGQIFKSEKNFVKRGDEYFIKSASGVQVSFSDIDKGMKKLADGNHSVDDFLTWLPRETADGTPIRAIVKDSVSIYKKNTGKSITKKDPVSKVKILDDVTDDLEAFGRWTTNVNSANDQTSLELYNKIVNIGKKLDGGSGTWKYGELRAQVDGRLIVDVVADGERFLMYKSLGKGTTASTAGEWTPLIGFAKDGWFIKHKHLGVDPKFNKYGSRIFKSIADDLKKKEAQLF